MKLSAAMRWASSAARPNPRSANQSSHRQSRKSLARTMRIACLANRSRAPSASTSGAVTEILHRKCLKEGSMQSSLPDVPSRSGAQGVRAHGVRARRTNANCTATLPAESRARAVVGSHGHSESACHARALRRVPMSRCVLTFHSRHHSRGKAEHNRPTINSATNAAVTHDAKVPTAIRMLASKRPPTTATQSRDSRKE